MPVIVVGRLDDEEVLFRVGGQDGGGGAGAIAREDERLGVKVELA